MTPTIQSQTLPQAPGEVHPEYYPVFISMTPPQSQKDDIHVKVSPRPALPHMVTIKELAAECKEKGISVTEHFIRRLCVEDKICCVKAGSKYLINYDRFVDFLNGGEEQTGEEREASRGIQPIPTNLKWSKKERGIL